MSDDSSPVFRRRRRQPIAPKSLNSPSQGRAALVNSPPENSAALESSAVAPRISDDDALALQRRPFRIRINPPQTPDSPSQGQSKLAVPPTPGSDAWKEARANERAVRRQEKEERRKQREARKRESDTNRQRYLSNRFMAHQAKEVNDNDESLEGSPDSEDDGYYTYYLLFAISIQFSDYATCSHDTDESNVTHGSDHPVAPRNVYVESLSSQGRAMGFGTPMHLQRGRASFRCYRHSLATPVCIGFWSHLTCTDHPSIQLLVSQKAL